MAPSRVVVLAAVAALAASALACDSLLGLGSYQEVDPDSGSGVAEPEGGGDAADTGPDTTTDVSEGGVQFDASDGGDAGDTSVVFDGSGDGPPLTELWARWPMPNPDASSALTIDGAPSLPNPMTYDGGGDAGTAFDVVTGLTWSTAFVSATDFGNAASTCNGMGAGWHVPTRIQLVSLVDFTQPYQAPTIDPTTFPGTRADTFWTSSRPPGDAATVYWVVDFSTGLAQQKSGANYVRCVKEGP